MMFSATADSSASRSARTDYRPEVDGLRAVSILSVLLYHLGAGIAPGGFIGVDVFFVISGFLITRILLDQLAAGRLSFAEFYARRARRILPALFAMLAMAALFAFLLLTPAELEKFTEQALHAVFQVSNFLFAEKVGYFEIDRTPSSLLHTWSLAIEEQFYLVWPLLIWFFVGRRGYPAAIVFTVAITASFVLAATTLSHFERFAFYHLPPRAWELAVGALLAAPAAVKTLEARLESRWLREAAAAAGLALILYAALFYSKATPFPGPAAAAPVFGAALVIAAGCAGPTATSRLLSLSPIVALGLISYSVYLWHWPMIIFTKLYFASPELTQFQMAAVGAASLTAGWLSWRFVERPARTALWTPRVTALRYGGVAAVLAAVTIFVGATRDAPWRFVEPAIASERLFGSKPRHPECVNAQPSPNYAFFDEHCTFGPSAPVFDALIWGDSHAHHYLPAIEDWAKEKGLTIRLASFVGCPPLLNDFRYFIRGKEKTRCRRNSDYILEAIKASGRVKYVFFGLRFSTYFRRDDRFANQYLLDGESDDTGTDASHAAFERGLRRTFRKLRELGVEPIVLGEVPRLARDPGECVRRAGAPLRRIIPLAEEAPCGKLNKAYNGGIKALSDAAIRRAASEAGAVYFDAAAHLPNGFGDGVYLYLDDNHLTVDGAMHLRRSMRF